MAHNLLAMSKTFIPTQVVPNLKVVEILVLLYFLVKIDYLKININWDWESIDRVMNSTRLHFIGSYLGCLPGLSI